MNKKNDVNFNQLANKVKDVDINQLFLDNNNSVFIDKKKKNFLLVFTNRKIMLWLTIFTFVFTLITVGKTFYLRSIVDEYLDYVVEIEYKEDDKAIIDIEDKYVIEELKDMAASELVSCINSSVDVSDLPDSVTSVIDEINNYYNQSNNHFAFKYKDLYTGFSVSYNENQNIFVASTIKAPKDIYIYEMASLGKINLNEKLTYTKDYYINGSGVLKNRKFNVDYTVRELLYFSTVYSDNAAHNMLMDRYGRNNILNFWREKGTKTIFSANTNWGPINAHDGAIYMEELYKFYTENDEYGKEVMTNFINAKPKFIKGKNNYKVANKSGWSGTAIHDVSIIFADNPYIVVVLSNLGQTDYYMSYFNKVNDLAYKLHTEYWKYKMDYCNEIKQY